MKLSLVFAPFLAAGVMMMGGCGGVMSQACAATVKQVAVASSLVAQAQAAVDQAQLEIGRLNLGKQDLAKAMDAIFAARAALQTASGLLAEAQTQCEQPDIRDAITAFVRAWSTIRPILSLIGGDGSRVIEDPALYVRHSQ